MYTISSTTSVPREEYEWGSRLGVVPCLLCHVGRVVVPCGSADYTLYTSSLVLEGEGQDMELTNVPV